MNNILFSVRAKTYTLSICLLLLSFISCKKEITNSTSVSLNKSIKKLYKTELYHVINTLDSLSNATSKPERIKLYKKARMHFKTLEPILAYIDQNNFKSLNAPNILQVHEEDPTDIKIKNPFGFQVIEELIHEDTSNLKELHNTLHITISRLKLLNKNIHIDFKDHHIIWLIRNEISRIATTGITGYDSPVLGQSLLESQYAYNTLEDITRLTEKKFKSKTLYKAFMHSISEAKKALNNDFDSFDRYRFIKNHIHPQLELLLKIKNDWKVEFPFELGLTNNITSLFSKKALNKNFFADYKSDTTQLSKKIAFGKTLFNDKNLSKDRNMSCASCHISEKAFTDGKITFNSGQTRNTPTLTYATYQQLFFMDARTGSLEGQIIGVVNNHNEFNMSMDSIVDRIKNDDTYTILFDSLYTSNNKDNFNIRHAIASYVRTLSPFNSKFDRNINNQENTLTTSEINGFNLFTGKAQCATCHFAPVFNGTIPPEFKETEMELIGVPKKNDTLNAVISDDLGRYNVFNTPERKHFFKTPTVRNIELTAPYMHNGVYNTLEEVIDFYNRGGGSGIGIKQEYQTLPSDSLNLSEMEKSDIVAFLKTLTDNNFQPNNQKQKSIKTY